MIEQIVTQVLVWMDGKDIGALKSALYSVLSEYEIAPKCTEVQRIDRSWEKELGIFLIRKRVDGRSERTLKQYNLHLRKMLMCINRPVNEITDRDLFAYLATYKKQRRVSNAYLDGIRLVLSSFFGWLNAKGYTKNNPAAGLDPIKAEQRIKKPLSDVELEQLRRKCKPERDLALIEFLYSTGVRASELVALNRQDIDFNDMDVIVYGKGSKERETYLTASSCLHLKEYLDSRTDTNEALFVSLRSPHERLTVSGVEEILRRLGRQTGIEKVHPHRFRRTMATNILNKGMPIEEVKEILGHVKLDTTMIYCQVSRENVRHSHRKYMSA